MSRYWFSRCLLITESPRTPGHYRYLCHGTYWCTHSLAHIHILRFLLYLHVWNSCLRLCQLVYALFSSSVFIHIYCHIYMYICFDYSIMTPYNLYSEIIIRPCVPAPRGFEQYLHTSDPMFKGLFLIFIHVYDSSGYTYTIFISKNSNSACTYPFLTCVLQLCLYPYLFYPPKQVLTCECLY